MRKSHLYICIAAIAFVGLLSLLLLFTGIFVPDGSRLALGGFEKIFHSSPEISFESGSLVTRFGDYSLNLNFGFNKPFLAFMPDGSGDIHVNILVVIAIVAGMAFSCFLPEASIATSASVGVFGLLTVVRMIDTVKLSAKSAGNWEAAAGCFWVLSFVFAFLLFNGMIGIGNKILRGVFLFDIGRVLLTFVLAGLLANAFTMVLTALAYLTIGLGFFGGIVLWFVVSLIFVAFCEVMDVMAY